MATALQAQPQTCPRCKGFMSLSFDPDEIMCLQCGYVHYLEVSNNHNGSSFPFAFARYSGEYPAMTGRTVTICSPDSAPAPAQRGGFGPLRLFGYLSPSCPFCEEGMEFSYYTSDRPVYLKRRSRLYWVGYRCGQRHVIWLAMDGEQYVWR